MISVGGGDGDGRKGLGLEMEQSELEEGEALSYHDEDEDSTLDPDIDLSYIEEKIQNVLGHFQKDFEGGVVSAENLGAKFGGYGSFLPAYQRSPSFSHAPDGHRNDAQRSPRKLHAEDRGQSSFASASVSPSGRPNAGSRKTSCTPRLAEESPSDCGFIKKSVNHSDQRTLKVRIKVGTENLSTQKNAEIYSGLGLVVTPSSSLDNSPATSEGQREKSLNLPEESPTSILQIMTSSPMGLMLSPLPDDLVYLTEKGKLRVKTESKPVDKTSTESSGILVNGSHSSRSNQKVVEQKKPRLSEKNNAFSVELSSLKNSGDRDDSTSLVKKEKESYPQKDILKAAKLNVSKGRKALSAETTDKKSQNEVHGKQKNQLIADSSASPKNVKPDLHDLQKDHEKPGDVYKDFFGDLDFVEDGNESISEEKTSSEKRVNHITSKEKLNINNNGKTEKFPGVNTHEAPPIGNGPSSEAPTGMEKEEWVCCDKCSEWRLLPLGTDPKSLPDKWLCKMLTWLPGMNHCGIPEVETTNALRALYHPVAPIPAVVPDSQHDGINNNSNPASVCLALADSIREHQNIPIRTTVNSGKKKHGSTKAENSTDLDSSTHSSSSRKKNLPKAGKDSNLNRGNHFPKDTTNLNRKSKPASDLDDHRSSKRMKGEELRETEISTSDYHNNRKDSRDDVKKKIVSQMHTPGSDGGSIRSSKSNDKDSVRKRKGNRDSQINTKPLSSYTEEMCENDLRKEKKSRVSKSGAKDTGGSKANVGTEKKSDILSAQHSLAANSSSSKVSGSNKNKQEVKGSPVESVSSSPLRISKSNNADKVTSNRRYPAGKDNFSPLTDIGIDQIEMVKNDLVPTVNDNDGSHAKKIGNGLYSHSKEKTGTPGKADKFVVKKDSQDKKHIIQQEYDKEKPPMKSDQKSNSLPPLAKVQNEDFRSEKQNRVKAVDAFDKGDSSGGPSQSKKAQSGQLSNLRHPTPNSRNGRDVEAPSPARRDSSGYAGNNAIKEAKDLKHLADRQKNKGSSESSGLYLQSVLKFLHGASLLESGSGEGTKQYEYFVDIYRTTAKLCEFCAHEYEKSKDMAGAALAYKCMEVAYMRVVYSGHATASRDRNELQTSLQIVPPGESPSSSASDVDNLNHQATVDKAAVAKAVGSPQVSGSHVITSRNRSGCLRLLNFAQDVNFAMEASRKSRAAFAAAISRLGETPSKECISSLKKALDFNFHDIEGLLRLVRVAMDAITR